MAINYDKLMAWPFEDVRHHYTQRDTMLYALGVGLGTDPTNETELRFVYEKDLLALPTLLGCCKSSAFSIVRPLRCWA